MKYQRLHRQLTVKAVEKEYEQNKGAGVAQSVQSGYGQDDQAI
jgi:hypothetical protein